MLNSLIAILLIAAPAATDLPTIPGDRNAFCAHMHLLPPGNMLRVDPGARIDTNEFSGTYGPGAIMYKNIDVFGWIVAHCQGLLPIEKTAPPGQPV